MEQRASPFLEGVEESSIGNARIFSSLTTEQGRDVRHDVSEEKQMECWSCAWSRDGRFYAWSCGQRKVKIVPVSLLHNERRGEFCHTNIVTIDCRHIVTSVAFGSCDEAATKRSAVCVGYHSFNWQKHDTVLIVGLRTGRIRVFDIYNGRVLLELIDHSCCVSHLAFAPDASLLLSSSHDGTLKFWDLADDGNMTHTISISRHCQNPAVRQYVDHVAWSPDSQRIAAVGSFKTVLIFSAESRRCILKLVGHSRRVLCCDFSPDGVLLVSSSYDTTAILWNSHSGQAVLCLNHQFPAPSLWCPKDTDTAVYSCRFSQCGTQLVTVASDEFVRFWNLKDVTWPSHITKASNPLSCSFNTGCSLLAVGTGSGSVAVIETPQLPISLTQRCRIVCNSHLKIQPNKVSNLPLPSVLKSYLDYRIISLTSDA